MPTLTIGQVAKKANVNVETVRFYQRIGLIQQPEKPAVGYRTYPNETLNRIRFIKRAQLLGFSLDETSQLLEMSDEQCETAEQMGRDKLHLIHQKIADLSKMASVLEEYTQQCAINSDHSHCPIIDTLIDESLY